MNEKLKQKIENFQEAWSRRCETIKKQEFDLHDNRRLLRRFVTEWSEIFIQSEIDDFKNYLHIYEQLNSELYLSLAIANSNLKKNKRRETKQMFVKIFEGITRIFKRD